jgi:hypothetical protein
VNTATGECTINGAAVHLTATGECTVTAAQNGDGTYQAATPVTQSFVIAKVVLCLSFA